jgi:hypothetical protein
MSEEGKIIGTMGSIPIPGTNFIPCNNWVPQLLGLIELFF